LQLTSARSFAEPMRFTISALRVAAPTNGAACCTGSGSRCQNAAVLACVEQAAALSARRQSKGEGDGIVHVRGQQLDCIASLRTGDHSTVCSLGCSRSGPAHLHAVNGWVQKVHILCSTDTVLSMMRSGRNIRQYAGSSILQVTPACCAHAGSGKVETSRRCVS